MCGFEENDNILKNNRFRPRYSTATMLIPTSHKQTSQELDPESLEILIARRHREGIQ
jgi:hypothetical protein